MIGRQDAFTRHFLAKRGNKGTVQNVSFIDILSLPSRHIQPFHDGKGATTGRIAN